MHYKQSLQIILLSITLNLVGSLLTTVTEIPLFLDAVGTMLSAILIGPWIGGLLGLMTNIIKGIIHTPHSIPFGIVNLAIGVLTGYLAIYTRDFRRPLVPLLIGTIIGLATPVMAAPIAAYMFGGITAHGVDKYVVALFDSGQSILSSAFWGRIPYSLVDKISSSYMVYLIVCWWKTAADNRFPITSRR